MSSKLGVAISCTYSIGARFTFSSGPRCLAESCVRRLITKRGSLPWAPNDGTDMRLYLNRANTDAGRFDAQRAAKDELEKDERVASATVTATYDAATKSMPLTIALDTADGPFTLVALVNDLTVELLSVTP